MKKPVILITVCRRFFELRKNLKTVWQRASELPIPPEVVLVWARPELGYLWLFNELMEEGLVQHLVERPAMEGEADGQASTWPESHNIRLGLEFIREKYTGQEVYAIVQAADVAPKDGVYARIHAHMEEGEQAFLCFLPTTYIHSDIWHTNFFAVGMDANYWPPLAKKDDADILERKWGLELRDKRLEHIVQFHNNFEKTFTHLHESESQPAEVYKPISVSAGLKLEVRSTIPWYERLWRWTVYLVGGGSKNVGN